MEFRTMYDLKKFNDDEYYEPGTSITEQGQVQSIQQILARCMRGEMVPTDRDLYYENEKVKTLEEAFANEDPTQADGFDLADTGPILAALSEKATAEADGSRLETPQAFLKTDGGTQPVAETNES